MKYIFNSRKASKVYGDSEWVRKSDGLEVSLVRTEFGITYGEIEGIGYQIHETTVEECCDREYSGKEEHLIIDSDGQTISAEHFLGNVLLEKKEIDFTGLFKDGTQSIVSNMFGTKSHYNGVIVCVNSFPYSPFVKGKLYCVINGAIKGEDNLFYTGKEDGFDTIKEISEFFSCEFFEVKF